MITNIFFSIICIFLKTRRLWLHLQCRNEFCMQKHPNKGIFIGFRENCLFSENFRKGYSMAIFILTTKKLIYTTLAIFGFFPSKKHDSFCFRKFCLKLIEKKKIENNDNKYFFSIFCISIKNRRLWLRFQCRNEFCMQKHHNKGIFIGFRENCLFSENFRKGYSMAIFILTTKKLIYTTSAIFGFFPSKKNDSFCFRKFCLKLIEKITKNRK